jgi:hypothetical protein
VRRPSLRRWVLRRGRLMAPRKRGKIRGKGKREKERKLEN